MQNSGQSDAPLPPAPLWPIRSSPPPLWPIRSSPPPIVANQKLLPPIVANQKLPPLIVANLKPPPLIVAIQKLPSPSLWPIRSYPPPHCGQSEAPLGTWSDVWRTVQPTAAAFIVSSLWSEKARRYLTVAVSLLYVGFPITMEDSVYNVWNVYKDRVGESCIWGTCVGKMDIGMVCWSSSIPMV